MKPFLDDTKTKFIQGLIGTIVAYNESILEKVDGDQGRAEGLITFEFEGMDVWNPLYDTTLRFDVDPVQEYGLEKIQEFIDQGLWLFEK